MFEHHSKPLLPKVRFYGRMIRYALFAGLIILASLLIGILGYHYFENLSWLDSLVNAAMILGGMGPVNELHTTYGKVFASCYALFSGMLLLVVVGILLAPLLHRFLHHFHLELEMKKAGSSQDKHKQPNPDK